MWPLAAVGLLGLAACGAETASAPGLTTSPATAPATPSPAEPGPASTAATNTTAAESATAPATQTLPLVGGGTFDASRLDRGPLALWFWAPG